ncbi:sensor histidine kinase [Methanoregula sp. UBA64]|jgi:PAS domain S-box-containing protein|uniref:sensor histidine kinase n=1 Tax=Methanoregula sp. UBA64 TaxID=1915554 RepID=UPI0025E2901C|nr:histidine kinase dimerization/phosphoacceptor domain -containing protein [Methanoregula sp. UBA64]
MSGIVPDIPVIINLVFSLIIVLLSIWGYTKIRKFTPLYFGFAYTLFSISHFLLLTQADSSPGSLFFFLRIGGYGCVVIGLFAILSDVIHLQDVERELTRSKDRLAATFDQAAVGIAEIGEGDQIVSANRRFSEILGYPATGIPSDLMTLTAPNDRRDTSAAIAAVMHGTLPGYSGELACRKNDGTEVTCQAFISPVRGDANRPAYAILVIEDISLRKKAQTDLARLTGQLEQRVIERTAELALANETLVSEVAQRSRAEERLQASLSEKDVLIKEIHHRVKNNLQVIISLLYLQEKKTPDPVCSAALMDSQTRIKSMALIHENLYKSGDLTSIDFDRYLRNLAGNLMVAYGVDRAGIRVTTDARDLIVTITTAIPLGLIANELISNALKYAFTGTGQGGEIVLTGRKDENGITLVVRDNGKGIPKDFDWENAESLGFNLVLMLARQLKGTVRLNRENGTEFTITVPARGK